MADFRYIKRGAEPNGKYHLNFEQLDHYLTEEPWEVAAAPFRAAPHVWYVSGIIDVSSWLIDTGDGLILIDCPSFGTLYLQLEAIRTAGFDPHDIKHIFLTHVHGDHYGGLRPMAEYTGAKVWMSRAAEEDLRDRKARGAMRISSFDPGFEFEPDFYYEDHNPVTIGNMTFKFRICPGHCAGSCVYFFEDTDPDTGKTYKVAMHGGVGETSTKRIAEAGNPLWHYYRFIADCYEMSEFDVDITLASHENQTNMFSGVNFEDPSDYSQFVNKDVWRNLLIAKAEDAIRMG